MKQNNILLIILLTLILGLTPVFDVAASEVNENDVGESLEVLDDFENEAVMSEMDETDLEKNEVLSTVENSIETPNEENNIKIKYQAHVAKIGWQEDKYNGELAGTTGQLLAIEALKISLENLSEDESELSDIEYCAHVQDVGWQEFVNANSVAGTTGQSKRVEAVKIRLVGAVAEKYDVYYRVHVQDFGWLDWAKNGEAAGTQGRSKRVEAIEIQLIAKGEDAPGSVDCPFKYSGVRYQTHIQDIGWQSVVANNDVAGTIGQSKRIEAIQIQLPETKYEGGIEYRTFVQNIGWQEWKANGELAGTTGKGLRIEAIQIRLTGEMANYFDVYYSVHMSEIGWCNYAVNGEITGSSDLSKRIEAIKIMLVEKDVDSAPNTTGVKFIEGYHYSELTYEGQIQGSGMSGLVSHGNILGTVGQSKRLENVTLYLNKDSEYNPHGSIQYSTHVSNVGWSEWVEEGTVSGCTDGTQGLEAIKIRLTDDLVKYYDIYYRAYVQSYGWLGWAKNGQPAGTSKIGYRLEAIQIMLVSKDVAKPGDNVNYYTEQKMYSGPDKDMAIRADFYSSVTPYIIMVDRSTHKVGIYQGWQGAWNCIQYWDCTTGKPSTPTVTGVFKVGSRGYYFDSFGVRCFWWTQFYNDYLFHSVCYNKNGTLYDGRLGMSLSHGCVRLNINNAKWIYDNIPTATTVVVYN